VPGPGCWARCRSAVVVAFLAGEVRKGRRGGQLAMDAWLNRYPAVVHSRPFAVMIRWKPRPGKWVMPMDTLHPCRAVRSSSRARSARSGSVSERNEMPLSLSCDAHEAKRSLQLAA
jgi:hypothetical protein